MSNLVSLLTNNIYSGKCSGKLRLGIRGNFFLVMLTEELLSWILNIPYLDTAASKQVENTKAFELTIIKELGKMTRVTSG